MSYLGAALLCIAVLASWFGQLIGLPGNWFIVACAAVYAWLIDDDGGRLAISWQLVLVLVVLAVLGEVAELIAGALGVAKLGGSRRSAVLALLGMVGGVAGIFVGLPIPVVGSLVAAVLFAGLGAMAGAVLGESWAGRDWNTSVEVGKGAFVGRLLGTLAKMIICSTMVVVALAALVL